MYCLGCQQNERQFDVCYSVFDHEDAAASLLYAFKFRGERYLSKYLSALLADCFIDNLLEADYIVPVPMHKKGVSVRGYNQCELLCADLSNRLNIPTLNCLVKPVETKKQMTLAKAERAENVKGAFLCNADLQFKTILLVDDVLTTGATLNECANVLKKAGAVTVNCLTLNNVKDMYIETDTDIMADAFSEGNF
jgi:ComF family protein